MPAAIRAAILSSVFEAGPIVQTILVRRVAASKFHLILPWDCRRRPNRAAASRLYVS